MYKTFCYSDGSSFYNIWRYGLPESKLFIGLGNTSAWSNEASPPVPESSIYQQSNLFIYFPATRLYAAKQTASPSISSVSIKGKYFEYSEDLSLTNIKSNGYDLAYVECDVEHNLLTSSTFRSMGVYGLIDYNAGVVEGEASYTPGNLETYLKYLEYFPPINKTSGLTQTFRIVFKG
jgi:hypothetical protein